MSQPKEVTFATTGAENWLSIRADHLSHVLLHTSAIFQAHFAEPLSDKEFVEYPIIVVAKWNKAPLVKHDRVEGNVCYEGETHTEILIERIIKGKVALGKHKVLLRWGIRQLQCLSVSKM